MTGFTIDWLDLRESADLRARNGELLERAWQWLETGFPTGATVVDLGAGTGSTLRAFANSASSSGAAQKLLTWRLVDHAGELLAEARRRHGASHRLESHELDLTDIAALPLDGAQLVTASALFDLVSADFLEALVAALSPLHGAGQQPAALYSTLNYDGTTHWLPVHPMDDAVLAAFNADQLRNKGFGLALGPGAVSCAERLLSQAGFRVFTASSPWVLGGADSDLLDALIEGTGKAVAQAAGMDGASLNDWIQFRKAHVDTGTCIVGHQDLLACPGE